MKPNPLFILIPSLPTNKEPTVPDFKILDAERSSFASSKTLEVQKMDHCLEKRIAVQFGQNPTDIVFGERSNLHRLPGDGECRRSLAAR